MFCKKDPKNKHASLALIFDLFDLDKSGEMERVRRRAPAVHVHTRDSPASYPV